MSMLNGNIIGAKRHNVRGVNELYDAFTPINHQIIHVANTTGFGTTSALTLTHPASVQAGDLCVLLHQGWDNDDDYIDAAPAGFTTNRKMKIEYISIPSTWQSQVISYRVLPDTSNITLPIGVIDGTTTPTAVDNQAYTAIYFRLTSTRGISSFNTFSATTGNPGRQIVTSPTGIFSAIVFGSVSIISGTPAFSEELPAFDATITNTAATNIETIVGYKIYNLSYSTHAIDMNDLGASNILTAFYIKA